MRAAAGNPCRGFPFWATPVVLFMRPSWKLKEQKYKKIARFMGLTTITVMVQGNSCVSFFEIEMVGISCAHIGRSL